MSIELILRDTFLLFRNERADASVCVRVRLYVAFHLFLLVHLAHDVSAFVSQLAAQTGCDENQAAAPSPFCCGCKTPLFERHHCLPLEILI